MSSDHKAALAEGRQQSRAVRDYLEVLDTQRPKRGRKRTPETVQKRLEAIEAGLKDANPLSRLQLVQERMDLQAEREAMDSRVDLSAIEEAFVTAAQPYGERKGIRYTAWREVGVPADVLKRAGIRRSAT